MDSLRSREVVDSAATVRRFLEETYTDEGEGSEFETRNGLAAICMECIKVFEAFVRIDKNDSKNQEGSISLTRSYSRLKVWADENGVMDGSLDELLTSAPGILRQEVQKQIVKISEVLTTRTVQCEAMPDKVLGLPDTTGIILSASSQESLKRLHSFVLTATDGESDGSESSTSTTSNDSFSKVLEDLKTYTTYLEELEPSLNDVLLQSHLEPATSWSPYQSFSDKINNRFPHADASLVDRLGKANYARYLRREKARSNAKSLSEDEKLGHLTPGNASTGFHDSGIGTSLPTTASSYADTVMSYGTESAGRDRRVRMPPLPPEAREGKSFDCTYCGKHVKISSNTAWKRHVFEDLQPWICLEAECPVSDLTFPTRNDWVTHLALDHRLEPDWPSMECPLCKRATMSGRLVVIAHLASHLEEISLGSLPVACDFDEESEADNSQEDIDIGPMWKPANLPFPGSLWDPYHELTYLGRKPEYKMDKSESPLPSGHVEVVLGPGDRSDNLSMVAEPGGDQIPWKEEPDIEPWSEFSLFEGIISPVELLGGIEYPSKDIKYPREDMEYPSDIEFQLRENTTKPGKHDRMSIMPENLHHVPGEESTRNLNSSKDKETISETSSFDPDKCPWPGCNYKCTSRKNRTSNLERHYKTHAGELRCPFCNKVIKDMRMRSLNLHIGRHHNIVVPRKSTMKATKVASGSQAGIAPQDVQAPQPGLTIPQLAEPTTLRSGDTAIETSSGPQAGEDHPNVVKKPRPCSPIPQRTNDQQ